MPRNIAPLAAAVAKVAVAGVLGGPVAGVREAGNQAVQLVLSAHDHPGPARELRQITARVEAGLESFARSEGLDDEAAARALVNTHDVLARFGPSAADLTDADLDAGRVAGLIRSRARTMLDSLDESDRTLCDRALGAVAEAIVAKPAQLEKLTQEFQRAVLSRLTEQAAGVDDLRRAVLGFEASAVLDEAVWPWWRDQYPPSALLRAGYGIVPFFGRDDETRELTGWLSEGPMTALTAFSGPGGIGKTRLLLQVCARARGDGWRAGFVHPGITEVTGDQLRRLGDGHEGVLIVVDYAETRRPLTAGVIEAALQVGVRVRIVLLARSLGDWWQELSYSPGKVGDFISGPATTRRRTAAVAPDPDVRLEVMRQAQQAFAAVLDRPGPPDTVSELRGELYERVLFIHLRALAAVVGEDTDGQRGLLSFALRREQAYLDQALRAQGLDRLAGRPIRQAAAIATMAGGCDSRQAAVDLMRQVPLLAGQPEADLNRVAEVLHDHYPAATWLAGVQPDLLGEHLVATSIDDDPALLLGAFGAAR